MPKEKVKVSEDESVKVGWSKEHNYVEVGVDIGTNLIVVDPRDDGTLYVQAFQDLFVTFDEKDKLDKFIRTLMRARKQAFKK